MSFLLSFLLFWGVGRGGFGGLGAAVQVVLEVGSPSKGAASRDLSKNEARAPMRRRPGKSFSFRASEWLRLAHLPQAWPPQILDLKSKGGQALGLTLKLQEHDYDTLQRNPRRG